VNDVRDVDSDRQHPKKRFRPIAAGELGPNTALVLAAVCLVASLGLGWFVNPLLGVTVATYWVLQVGYSVFLKHQPIIDLAMVASGFLLRAVAGGVASSIELSQWFLLVASFGSLFMVAGKRYSEHVELGPAAGTRASLERYTDTYLRFVWTTACTAVIMSYSLWAFEQRGDADLLGIGWHAISIAPFTLALLRYAYVIDTGAAGEPEDVVLSDRVLQWLAVAWVVPLAIGIFL
ncbi:MAG: decaprenyl-phosphate phosphoribosyltransferase, partial [Actinomycetes bacterium]